MTYGGKILNTHGTVQIDETYRNMELYQSFVVNTNVYINNDAGNDPSNTTMSSVQLSVPYADASKYIFAAMTTVTGRRVGIYRRWYYAGPPEELITEIFVNAPTGTPITIFQYALPGLAPTSGFGLVVKNAAGLTCFNSASKPLRVVEMFDLASTSTPFTKSYTAGRSYAVITNKSMRRLKLYDRPHVGDPPDPLYWVRHETILLGAMCDTSTGTVYFDPVASSWSNLGTGYFKANWTEDSYNANFGTAVPGNFLVVDVTNF